MGRRPNRYRVRPTWLNALSVSKYNNNFHVPLFLLANYLDPKSTGIVFQVLKGVVVVVVAHNCSNSAARVLSIQSMASRQWLYTITVFFYAHLDSPFITKTKLYYLALVTLLVKNAI